MIGRIEQWLDRERDQLALWLPVALGCGIAGWFIIPTKEGWIALVLALAAAAICAAMMGQGRLRRALVLFPLLAASGCALAWWRSDRVEAPRLERPAIAQFTARIETVEMLVARDGIRLTLAPDPGQSLPDRVRVNVDPTKVPPDLEPGARVSLRARLMPPMPAALPGAYDFARVAWFRGLGATGTALDSVKIIRPPFDGGFDRWINALRHRLTVHVINAVGGSPGGVAASFITGDQGAIAEEDVDAMRTSGLAHLLSISGLHVAAVIGGAMLLVLRLLALSPALALRAPLPLIAAGFAALAGIAYTLLAGAEVPAVRSCIAAILILIALVLGREGMTLRLVAAGAMLVLLLWPEALIGPSFQLSFAAVVAIVAFHELPSVRELSRHREEDGWIMKSGRHALVLLITGLAVELALAPIALYHFHRSGIYGSIANMIAIPLTTFIIMPAGAIGLLLDSLGCGRPFWWLAAMAIKLLLYIAKYVAERPGSVASLPNMPDFAFAMMLASGLWMCLWRSKARWLAVPVFVVGASWAAAAPSPDLLITGDGRHVALRTGNGMALLRSRTGDYVRDMISTLSASPELGDLDRLPTARCNADLCLADVVRGERRLRLLATRSPYLIPWREMIAACAQADIVVSDRRLPPGCTPRWLKADRTLLKQTGGLAISFDPLVIRRVRRMRDDHPWMEINPASYPR